MRVAHKKAVLILMLSAIFVYGIFQTRDYLMGPRILLESPEEGQIFKGNLIEVSGKINDVSRVTLDGRLIFTNEAGEFKEKTLLAPGVNVIELKAEDKFGHKTSVNRTVLMKAE